MKIGSVGIYWLFWNRWVDHHSQPQSSSFVDVAVGGQTVAQLLSLVGAHHHDGSSTNDPLSPAVVIDRPPHRTNYWTTLRALLSSPRPWTWTRIIGAAPSCGPLYQSRGAFVRELIPNRSFDVSMLQSYNYFDRNLIYINRLRQNTSVFLVPFIFAGSEEWPYHLFLTLVWPTLVSISAA